MNRYLEKIAELHKEAANPDALRAALVKAHGSFEEGVKHIANKVADKHSTRLSIANAVSPVSKGLGDAIANRAPGVSKLSRVFPKNLGTYAEKPYRETLLKRFPNLAR